MRRLSSLLLPHSAALPGLAREAERAALTAGLEGTLYMTDFTRRAAHLQRRCDALQPTTATLSGSQATSARRLQQRREAQRFLDAEVPKQEVNAWLEQGGNAIALCQVLQRFDLRPDPTLSALLVNKLVRTAEDDAVAALPRLQAMSALTALRPEENYERAFSVVEAVLKSTADAVKEEKARDDANEATTPTQWQLYELAGCVLQRCGKRVPTLLTERLVQAVSQALSTCAPQECPSISGPALLQLYEWMVQSELAEAGHVLYALMQQVDHLPSALFVRLMRTCKAHHMQRALPVQLLVDLSRSALGYAARASCSEAATVLGVMRDLLHSLAVGQNETTAADIDSVTDWFHALLAEYQDRVVQLMRREESSVDSSNTGSTDTDAVNAEIDQPQCAEDIVTLATAYLLSQSGCGGGVLRYREVARAFVRCITAHMETATPQLLLATAHVLQRIQLLSLSPSAEERDMGKAYGEVLCALHNRLAELVPTLDVTQLVSLAAIALTLPPPPPQQQRAGTSQPTPPSWVAEARAAVTQYLSSNDKDSIMNATALTKLQLALAFPSEEMQPGGAVVGATPWNELTLPELLPLLPLALGSTTWLTPVLNALLTRLANPAERVGVDELRWMLCMGNAMLSGAVNAYLYQHLMQPTWSSNTVSYLALLPAGQAASGPGCDVQKALSAITSAALTPELAVSYIAMLCAVYGDTNEPLAGFVQSTSARLLQANVASVRTVVRFLAAVRGHTKLQPDAHWLSVLVEEMSPQLPTLSAAQVESLLLSLHTIYGDIRRTPALQMLLWELVAHHIACGGDGGRTTASQAVSGEQRARIVVLLVYLQQGLSLPLLTRTTPWVAQVLQHEADYAQDIRAALQNMPLPGGELDQGSAQSDEPTRFTLALPDEAQGTASPAAESSDDAATHDENDGTTQADATAEEKQQEAAQHEATTLAEEKHAAADNDHSNAEPTTHDTDNSTQERDINATTSQAEQSAEHSEAAQTATAEQNQGSTSDDQKKNLDADDSSHAAAASTSSPANGSNTYYSSFFNRSVGHIFTGKGALRNAQSATTSTANSAEREDSGDGSTSPDNQTTQQEQANNSNTTVTSQTTPLVQPWADTPAPPTFATEASHLGSIWGIPSALQAMPAVEQPVPAAVPLGQPLTLGNSGATALYGLPNAPQGTSAFANLFQQQAQSQQQQQQQQPMAGYGIGQEAASGAFGASRSATTTPSFDALFQSSTRPGAAPMPAASTGTRPPQAQTPTTATPMSTPLVHPGSNPTTVTRTPMVGGNNIFYNPATSATTRPVVTRKAVITRLAGRFADDVTTSTPSSSSSPPSATVSSFTANGGGATSVYARPGSRYTSIQPAGSNNNNNGNSYLSGNTNTHTTPTSSGSATANTTFMQQAGLRRITGYNMNHIVDERNSNNNNESNAMSGRTATTSPSMPSTSSAPLAWQEAARAVSRISRHGKTNNTKTRSQQSLSDWLSTPTQQAAAAAAAAAANANGGRRETSEQPAQTTHQSGARASLRSAGHVPTRGRPRNKVGKSHEENAAREHGGSGRGRGGRKAHNASSHAQHHNTHHGNNNNNYSSGGSSSGRAAGRKNSNASSNASGRGAGGSATAAAKRNAAHGHHHHHHHSNSAGGSNNNSGGNGSHGAGTRKSAKKTVKETAKRAGPARKAPAHKPKHGKKR